MGEKANTEKGINEPMRMQGRRLSPRYRPTVNYSTSPLQLNGDRRNRELEYEWVKLHMSAPIYQYHGYKEQNMKKKKRNHPCFARYDYDA